MNIERSAKNKLFLARFLLLSVPALPIIELEIHAKAQLHQVIYNITTINIRCIIIDTKDLTTIFKKKPKKPG